jgi:hypothetical protein
VYDGDESGLQKTIPGEVLYQDISEKSSTAFTLTRYFNYRDAEPTKMVDDNQDESKSTKDFVMFVESVDGSIEGKAKLKEAAYDLQRAYEHVYGEGIEQSFVRIVEVQSKEEEATLSLDFSHP